MSTSQFTDAIALLKADHRAAEALFDRFESAHTPAQQAIAIDVCNALKIHAQIEEEIFYPALKGKIEGAALDEAYVEHDGAKLLITDILAGNGSDEMRAAKVKVLAEEIKHHVHEEEMPGDGLFAMARAAGIDLVKLGDKLLARKAELSAVLEKGDLPPAELRVIQV